MFYLCLSVCPLGHSKSYKWILMTVFGGVESRPRNNLSDFGGDLDEEFKKMII